MTKYGQADYMLFLMQQITEKLADKSLLTTEQKAQLDKLNTETVSAEYPSVRDYELTA